jgi:O-antigen/teichoic acid export membrane protein
VYVLGFRIPELLIKQFYVALGQVLFPVFTKLKAQSEIFSQGFLITLRYILMITAPMAIGLALISQPLVILAFGEKWADAIPVMAAISIYTLFSSLDFNSGDVFKAQGRPDIIPRIQLLNLVVAIPVLWWSVAYFGTIIAVAWAQVGLAIVLGIVRLFIVAHLLSIPKIKIFQLFQPLFVSTGIMATVILIILELFAGTSPLIQLVLTIPIGALVYIVSLWLFEREAVLQAGQVLRSTVSGGY